MEAKAATIEADMHPAACSTEAQASRSLPAGTGHMPVSARAAAYPQARSDRFEAERKLKHALEEKRSLALRATRLESEKAELLEVNAALRQHSLGFLRQQQGLQAQLQSLTATPQEAAPASALPSVLPATVDSQNDAPQSTRIASDATALQHHIELEQTKLSSLRADSADLGERIAALQQHAHIHQGTIAQMQSQVAEKAAALAQQTQQCSTLQQQLDTATQQAGSLIESIKLQQGNLIDLQAEHAALVQQHAELKGACAAKQADVHRVLQEIAELDDAEISQQARLSAKREANQALHQQLHDRQQQEAELAGSIAAQQAAIGSLEAQHAQLAATAAELHGLVQQGSKAVKGAREQLAGMDKDNAVLAAEVAQLDTSNTKLQLEVTAAREREALSRQALQAHLHTAQADRASLQQLQVVLMPQIDQLRQAVAGFEQQKAGLLDSQQTAEIAIASLQQELSRLSAYQQALSLQVEHAQAGCDQPRLTLSALQARMQLDTNAAQQQLADSTMPEQPSTGDDEEQAGRRGVSSQAMGSEHEVCPLSSASPAVSGHLGHGILMSHLTTAYIGFSD